jgi:hypothetical protein
MNKKIKTFETNKKPKIMSVTYSYFLCLMVFMQDLFEDFSLIEFFTLVFTFPKKKLIN